MKTTGGTGTAITESEVSVVGDEERHEEVKGNSDPAELSLRDLLLSNIGKLLTDELGGRVHLLTAAGLISGDMESPDGGESGPATLENGLAEIAQNIGATIRRDLVRLKRAEVHAGDRVVRFHDGLWVNPDAIIAMTFGTADQETPGQS